MDRKNQFEKGKITKGSTNKVVTNVYYDAFPIEKVRIQNANYIDKTSIDYYLDFEDVSLLAADAASGRLIKEIEAGTKKPYMGGSKSSKNYNGAPESRILSFAKSNDTIFINISRGKGKLTETGAIAPDGKPDLKIGVPVSIDKFRSMFIFARDNMIGYFAHMVNKIVKECETDRENYQASN